MRLYQGEGVLKKTIVRLLLLLASSCCSAAERPKLHWVVPDLPPLVIKQGEYKGEGLYQQLIQLYQNALSDYEHIVIVVNIARIHRLIMDVSKDFCVPSAFKISSWTERRTYGSFNVLSGGTVIATVRSKANKLTQIQPFSLRDLLTDKSLSLGMSKNRSFGAIDQVIQRYGSEQNVLKFAVSGEGTLYRMLQGGRIDYLLALAFEPLYHAERLNMHDEILTLTLDGAGGFINGYPTCSGNDWGRQVIERLNQVSQSAELQQANLAFINRWMPADSAAIFARAYHQAYFREYGKSIQGETRPHD